MLLAMNERSLLCVAHPGHELRVYGWLAQARPIVCVVTDGSGRSGRSRIEATRETLLETGCVVGPVFAPLTDADAYRAVTTADAAPFIRIIDDLVRTIVECDIRCLVGDAAEGYNPAHDVCRLILNGAGEACRRRGHALRNLEFPLFGDPAACPDALRSQAVELRLSEAMFEAKLKAARREADLGVDVDQALREAGADAFRCEVLRPCLTTGPTDGLPDAPTVYERYGEGKVAEGKYATVIRRREHVLPLAAALWRHAESAGP